MLHKPPHALPTPRSDTRLRCTKQKSQKHRDESKVKAPCKHYLISEDKIQIGCALYKQQKSITHSRTEIIIHKDNVSFGRNLHYYIKNLHLHTTETRRWVELYGTIVVQEITLDFLKHWNMGILPFVSNRHLSFREE